MRTTRGRRKKPRRHSLSRHTCRSPTDLTDTFRRGWHVSVPAPPALDARRRIDWVSPENRLTHVDDHGAARMVDVSDKQTSAREAVASGVFRTTEEVVRLLRAEQLPKGDALATARIAGIMAAKRTSELIPLCHPLALTGVTVYLHTTGCEVQITATVRTTDRTGVEMEALTAVAVAGLALHDMVKAVDPAAVLDAVRVERKEGGKTGTWTRPSEAEGAGASQGAPATEERTAPGSRPFDPEAEGARASQGAPATEERTAPGSRPFDPEAEGARAS